MYPSMHLDRGYIPACTWAEGLCGQGVVRKGAWTGECGLGLWIEEVGCG